jgi:hypothetical protein
MLPSFVVLKIEDRTLRMKIIEDYFHVIGFLDQSNIVVFVKLHPDHTITQFRGNSSLPWGSAVTDGSHDSTQHFPGKSMIYEPCRITKWPVIKFWPHTIAAVSLSAACCRNFFLNIHHSILEVISFSIRPMYFSAISCTATRYDLSVPHSWSMSAVNGAVRIFL